MHSIESIRLGC